MEMPIGSLISEDEESFGAPVGVMRLKRIR